MTGQVVDSDLYNLQKDMNKKFDKIIEQNEKIIELLERFKFNDDKRLRTI
jgi:hypothetical protein